MIIFQYFRIAENKEKKYFSEQRQLTELEFCSPPCRVISISRIYGSPLMVLRVKFVSERYDRAIRSTVLPDVEARVLNDFA